MKYPLHSPVMRILAGLIALGLAVPMLVAISHFPVWPLSLAGNFLAQAALLCAVLAVLLVLRKAFALAGLVALIAAGSVMVMATPQSVPRFQVALPASTDLAGHASLKVAHANLLGKSTALEKFITWVETSSPDIISLTELPGGAPQSALLTQLFKTYPYRTFSIIGGPARSLIASRYPISDHQASSRSAFSRLAFSRLIARAQIVLPRGQTVTVFSLHPPPPATPNLQYRRDKIITHAFTMAAQIKGPIIITGDFNTTPWMNPLQMLAERHGFFRAEHRIFANSWMLPFPGAGLPIDHIYTSAHFQLIDNITGPALGSDHLPILAQLVIVRDSAN